MCVCTFDHISFTDLLSFNVFSFLEADGMEETFKFKQEDIAAVVPLANSQQVKLVLLVSPSFIFGVTRFYSTLT